MFRIVAFLVLLPTWTCCLRTSAADEPIEPDAPNTPIHGLVELPDGWRWDRPVAGHAQRDGDAIRLRTEAARIWAGEGNENRIITKVPVGDTAKVFAEIELVDAVHKWEQCGLLVYQNDDSLRYTSKK